MIERAVVLSDGDRLEASDLLLPEAEAPPGAAADVLVPEPATPTIAPVVDGEVVGGFAAAWGALRGHLDAEVRAAASAQPRAALPLGRWLADDVVSPATRRPAACAPAPPSGWASR